MILAKVDCHPRWAILWCQFATHLVKLTILSCQIVNLSVQIHKKLSNRKNLHLEAGWGLQVS